VFTNNIIDDTIVTLHSKGWFHCGVLDFHWELFCKSSLLVIYTMIIILELGLYYWSRAECLAE